MLVKDSVREIFAFWYTILRAIPELLLIGFLFISKVIRKDHFQCLDFMPVGFFVYWTIGIEQIVKRCNILLWSYFAFQKNLIGLSKNVKIETGL